MEALEHETEVATIVRPRVEYEHVGRGMNTLLLKLQRRLSMKGDRSFASRHEILGILVEEFAEVNEAVRDDSQAGFVQFGEELLDVAVAAIFGYICMSGGYIKP